MKIKLHEVSISDLVAGYEDRGDGGVVGYGGRLDIRPPYQREYVYGDKMRDEVIRTVRKDFPLNTMYWAVNGDNYELMDGQQRTISICQYVVGDFSVEFDGKPIKFSGLTPEKRQQILDYKLFIYVCDGSEGERLDWFETINIAGLKLTPQELRNATYTGPWLSDAKVWFSKTGGPAYKIGGAYVNGIPNRQEILEVALDWISSGEIKQYMSDHQKDQDAQELWQYFQEVISWIQRTFPEYRQIMKGLEWGRLYRKYKDGKYNAKKLEQRIIELLDDDEVSSPKGIYEFLLSGETEIKSLQLRLFDKKTSQRTYDKQKGICPKCGPAKHYSY